MPILLCGEYLRSGIAGIPFTHEPLQKRCARPLCADMIGANVFMCSNVQQVLFVTLETHHLLGIFVVADATRAILHSDVPYYQAVNAFAMTFYGASRGKTVRVGFGVDERCREDGVFPGLTD